MNYRREVKIIKPVKDNKTGKWFIHYRLTDAFGNSKSTTKRGFQTKKQAEDWYMNFKLSQQGNLTMEFNSFVDIYIEDVKFKIRDNTWLSKEQIINTKIRPFFMNYRMCDIEPKDIIRWQNNIQAMKNKQGKPFAPTYLRSINSQLNAIFNHAMRYYGLKENPTTKVSPMGKKNSKEMKFWSKEEYLKFSEAMKWKPLSYYAFENLYWLGLRVGELLALTPDDFDFTQNTVRINKSYQRIKGEDVITPPKTEKSNRVITMPQFLADEMQDCINSTYKIGNNDRIFNITKSYLHHEMERGCKETGVKKIRIHDLRHSHVSLLISFGYSPVDIANRVGHESINITYKYAHMFPSVQNDMARKLDIERNK